MNSLILFVVALILFFFGYKFYSNKICKLFATDEKRATPAHVKFDGVDYVPARHWLILFGHHFASIAGAGPIIGPVVAVIAWGWMGVVIWIVFGTIFIGGVHDLGALLTSVREGGDSIAQVAENVISRRARIIFSIFLWLALVLVVAVFVHVCADTFIVQPKIVLPSLGLIPVAIVVGIMMYRLRINLVFSTAVGLVLLGALIYFGQFFPIKSTIMFWSVILLIYAFIASVTPVNILLQPRDYISSYLLFIGVFLGILSIILGRPQFNSPGFISWNTSSGPLWPMMCVVVACGAISGFHSLIASGTTSKQLANERHAKATAYGGMVCEGIVALLAVAAICAGFSKSENLAAMLKDLGPVGLFGQGYGNITKILIGGFGGFLAITILNAFILTTLDSATRITRYITTELLGIRNRFIATSIVVVFAGLLALSGKWNKLWPAFGASNQLVAALALIVISSYLLMNKKRIHYTLIPAVFMTVTAIFALFYQAFSYYKDKDYLLLAIAVILIGLAFFMIFEVLNKFLGRRMRKHA